MTAISPLVGLIMGSQSDWPTLRAAADLVLLTPLALLLLP